MAVVSAGPYASLHLAPDRQPCQYPTTLFFTGRMPFLPPNQQRQSTEGTCFILHPGVFWFGCKMFHLTSKPENSRMLKTDITGISSLLISQHYTLSTFGDEEDAITLGFGV